MLAKQGALFVDNNNGRDSRATKALFDSPEGEAIVTWYRDMVKDGLAYYAKDDTDALLSVVQQPARASMTIGSTAVLGVGIALVALNKEDPQRIGTGPIPAPLPPSGKQGGAVLGGASVWILKRKSQQEQQGAWEFLKFASRPEQQAQLYAETGYFPTRVSSYGLPAAQQRQAQFPQYRTAADQVRNSPNNPATEGALIGPFTQVRDRITRAFQEVLSGGGDPVIQLKAAANDATNSMRDYNRTVK
jgi:sn-glycerol 3-phosphate transport system substrate-binding protein